VILENPETIRIEPFVEIGPRTRIRPGTILEGRTQIGADSVVGPHVVLRNITLPEHSLVSAGRMEVLPPTQDH
jgi:bifunctional UDP-N-acetylglucosamine pyrophosphorylase/glucosamine-1-phosphate N-acetyltransferase